MKTYDKDNKYMSDEYLVDKSYIEVTLADPKNNLLKYCILERDYQASQKLQSPCDYKEAPEEIQKRIEISADKATKDGSCFATKKPLKYTQYNDKDTGKTKIKEKPMTRKNDCSFLRGMYGGGNHSYEGVEVELVDQRLWIFRYSDGNVFKIWSESGNNQYKCFMNTHMSFHPENKYSSFLKKKKRFMKRRKSRN